MDKSWDVLRTVVIVVGLAAWASAAWGVEPLDDQSLAKTHGSCECGYCDGPYYCEMPECQGTPDGEGNCDPAETEEPEDPWSIFIEAEGDETGEYQVKCGVRYQCKPLQGECAVSYQSGVFHWHGSCTFNLPWRVAESQMWVPVPIAESA